MNFNFCLKMLQALMFLVATGRVPLFQCAKPQKVHRLSFKPLVGPVLSTSGIVRVTPITISEVR